MRGDEDMPVRVIEKIERFIEETLPNTIGLGYMGETTCHKGWLEHIRKIRLSRKNISILTNMQRILIPDEAEAFSMIGDIYISLDSHENRILQLTRRGADIRNILYNMHSIRSSCIRNRSASPSFRWVCVLSDLNLDFLGQYIAFAASCRVKQIILHQMIHFHGTDPLAKDILDLDGDAFKRALEILENAKEIAKKYNLELSVGGEAVLQAKKNGERIRLSTQQTPLGLSSIYIVEPLSGQTRKCLLPWTNAVISVAGDVFPCAVSTTSLGNLEKAENLEQILSAEDFKKWRRSLLTGDLKACVCEECHCMPSCSVEELRGEVRNLFIHSRWITKALELQSQGDHGEALAYFSKAILLSPKDHHVLWRRGTAYLALNKHREAICDFDAAIKLDRQPHYLQSRGQTYLAKKRYDDSIADLTASIEMDSSNLITWQLRAQAYAAAGEIEKAKADMSQSELLSGNAGRML